MLKLWSTTSARSISTIDVGVNICCVHFAPDDANYLVLGAAGIDLFQNDRAVLFVGEQQLDLPSL